MKKILLTILPLLLIIGWTKLEPINLKTLTEKKGGYYTKDTNKPYNGPVFTLNKYDSETIEWQGSLKNGMPEGVWYKKFDNGQMDVQLNNKNGERNGLYTQWYQNGQKRYEVNYTDGKRDGILKTWHEKNGLKKEISKYIKGELISSKCWDKDGNERECN